MCDIFKARYISGLFKARYICGIFKARYEYRLLEAGCTCSRQVETHSFEVGLKKKIFTRLAIYVALLLATYVYSRLAICVAYLRLYVRVEPTEGSLYT